MIDAGQGLDAAAQAILDKLKGKKSPLILVLNKVDRVPKQRLLTLAADANARLPFAATFMVSALQGNGVADLKRYFARQVKPGPWHFPEDEISDAPLRLLAAEITREKIYARLHDELPYQTAVETTAWQEKKNGVRIEQTIFVERDSQKAHRAGQRRPDDQAALQRGAHASSPKSSSSPCTCSCSSRCAKTGKTIRNATGRWG